MKNQQPLGLAFSVHAYGGASKCALIEERERAGSGLAASIFHSNHQT
jgi:hypothetical protein